MHNGRSLTVLLVSIHCLAIGRAEEANKQPGPKPIEIRVIDARTGTPVKSFRYSYRILSPDKHDYPAKATDRTAKDGMFFIPAPQRLGLSLNVVSPYHFSKEWLGYEQLRVLPDDKQRRFVVKLEPAHRICGAVLDQEHGLPMVGVEVAPFDRDGIGFGFLHVPNRRRAVRTDEQGRFCVGTDKSRGIAIVWEDYWTNPNAEGSESPARQKLRQTPDGKTEAVIRLPRNPNVPAKGWFCSSGSESNRRPGKRTFEGVVTMANDSGAEATCTVIVAAVRDKTWWLETTWPWGYDRSETKDHVRLDCVRLGKAWSQSIETDESDSAYYVAALRKGCSPAVVRIDPEEDANKIDLPIVLELKQGIRVSGHVEGPGVSDGAAVAMLFPTDFLGDWCFDNELEWLTRTAKVARDGSFHFEQIEPGLFRLQVLSQKAGPYERMVVVGDTDKTLSRCRIKSFGRIEGVMYDLPGMVDTGLSEDPGLRVMRPAFWEKPIVFDTELGLELFGSGEFVTDENGRFVIERAPAGEIQVGFRYNVSLDFASIATDRAVVAPGRTSHVALAAELGQTEGLVTVPLDVVIGDGSFDALCAAWGRRDRPENPEDTESMWFWGVDKKLEIDVQLSPIGKLPQGVKGRDRWRERLKRGSQRVRLTNVAPGEYCLKVVPNSGWDSLFEKTIRVEAGTRPKPILAQLSASSIDVTLKHPNKELSGYVDYAVFCAGQKKPFRTGHFFTRFTNSERSRTDAIRFMPPGQYEILLWRDCYGWVRSGPIDAKLGQVAGAGVLTFQRGARVTGHLHLDQESRMPAMVNLIDSTGVERWTEVRWAGEEFVFEEDALWPGQWTARVMGEGGGEYVVAETTFEVRGIEPIELDMKGK